MSEARVDESALGEAIAEYLELERAGTAPSPREFAERHPECAAALKSCLDVLAAVSGAEEPGAGIPRVLGDFRILRLIGRGGMGLVYEAEQQSLPRRVALKVLPRASTLDRERAQRFRREIEATARLEDPHIVPVYAAGEVAGMPYYAMPLLRGRSLDRVIAGFREPSAAGALAYRAELVRWVERFIGVARALDHAHAESILHRDIKPSNLFLEDDGNLRVLDFGLTRSSAAEAVTLTGAAVGTPRYMSPEQILGSRVEIDGRSDLFSLAATFYELLTLAPAFPGENRESVFRAILADDPVPPRRIDRRLPRDLEVVLLKALEKDPRRRYASAGAFADELVRFLDYEPVRARPVGPVGRLRRRARRNPLAAAAVLVAALVALGAASTLLGQAAARRSETARRTRGEIEAALALQADLRRSSARGAELEEELWKAESGTHPWAPLESEAKTALLGLRREARAQREDRDRLFREALSHLFSAQRLSPGDPAARAALSALVFEEYRDAESRRDSDRMASLKPLAESTDDGAQGRERRGDGSVSLESDPSGAEVFLFRFEERGLLLVPVPFATGPLAGEPPVVEGKPPPNPWLFLRITRVDPPQSPLRPEDVVRMVCGTPPVSLESIVEHLSRTHPGFEDEEHIVELRRGGEETAVHLAPGAPGSLDGERVVRDPFALACDDASRIGRTPVAPRPLPMGSYLAVLRLEGHLDARVPFRIARLEEEQLSVALLTGSAVGRGFVHVPAGPAILGGDPGAAAAPPPRVRDLPAFSIGRLEVTFREYFAFLSALERRDPEGARARGPRSDSGGRLWKLDASGRIAPDLPATITIDCPVVGVSWSDARAYCAWLQAESPESGVVFDLPTPDEWEKAGRGADGRLFPWGDTFEWTFARLGRTAYISGLAEGGLYPTDASVYGVLDLAGSVREWCAGSERATTRIVRGGDHGTTLPADCHLANVSDRRSPEQVGLGTGFRVVQRPR